LQIETFENLATVGTGIIFQDFKLTIQGEKSNIEYQPNQQLLLSFDGSYKYIGGGVPLVYWVPRTMLLKIKLLITILEPIFIFGAGFWQQMCSFLGVLASAILLKMCH
jgi:hypothetical protein